MTSTENQAGLVRINNGMLDELPDGSVVLRGIIDERLFALIRADTYQRGTMKRPDIMEGYRLGAQIPDVELGMRGGDFDTDGNTFILKAPVFAIDGWQRISTALLHMDKIADSQVHLGAMIRFDTSEEYERNRFEVLNGISRVKVSINVMLRNKRNESKGVLMLYGLTNSEKPFVMHGRVAWGQNMVRGELISALNFARTVTKLHGHKTAASNTQLERIVKALDRGIETVGIQVMRDNIKTFFDLIDECWGIRKIHYRDGASYMKGSFLGVLARFFSEHKDFWHQPDERRLSIDAALRRKIAQFPVNDPQVVQLSGANGKAQEILYFLLRDHVNSGKRTKRLTPRYPAGENPCDGDE